MKKTKKAMKKKATLPSKQVQAAARKRARRLSADMISRFGISVPKTLNGFDPTLYSVTLRAEKIEGEDGWHFHATIAELPDAAVYEESPSSAYAAAMETIIALKEQSVEEKLPFPGPGAAPSDPKIDALRKALEFYDEARESKLPDGAEVGAVKDGHEWVMSAARDLIKQE